MIRRLITIVALLALFGGGGYVFYRTLVVGSTEPPPPVQTVVVKKADIEETIVCLGEVEPELFTDVKSEVSGRIKVVHVVSGQEVSEGDALIELDRSELESELREVELGIEAARFKMEKVQLDYESKEELARKDFVSQRELRDAEIDLNLARNDLEIQNAKLNTLREKLAKTVILAPHDGVVLDSVALVGMVITGATSFSEGTLLMQVAQLKKLRVNTDVNEIDVAKLVAGMPVELTFDSLPEESIEGRIVFISPSAEAESARSGESGAKVFPIIVSFETTNQRVRPGMSAKVNIVLSTAQDVLAAALPTLFLEEGKPVVYVKRGERFDRREVTTGISDHDVIEIKDGLHEGDELAMSKPEMGEGTEAPGGGARSS